MRLTYVKFRSLEKFDNNTTADEVRSTEATPLVFEPDEQLVYVGLEAFPAANVRKMVVEPNSQTCPECEQTFQDARALGAHRRHLHNIRGARSQKS